MRDGNIIIIKKKTEARDINNVLFSPWWGQEEEGWLGVFIFAEWLCCGFVILKWICPAWNYCQEFHVCFLWCFAQYCSRLPLCKINLPSICAPYIVFNYGEMSLLNQVSRCAGGFCPCGSQWELLCQLKPLAISDFWWLQCLWWNEWI